MVKISNPDAGWDAKFLSDSDRATMRAPYSRLAIMARVTLVGLLGTLIADAAPHLAGFVCSPGLGQLAASLLEKGNNACTREPSESMVGRGVAGLRVRKSSR